MMVQKAWSKPVAIAARGDLPGAVLADSLEDDPLTSPKCDGEDDSGDAARQRASKSDRPREQQRFATARRSRRDTESGSRAREAATTRARGKRGVQAARDRVCASAARPCGSSSFDGIGSDPERNNGRSPPPRRERPRIMPREQISLDVRALDAIVEHDRQQLAMCFSSDAKIRRPRC